ncbi:hypothetical protein N0V83_000691 [Neocucurbitaria cava]|uniref:Uncharacterized protein n=1 Tax=Neocucurbitaria cava TaxID=798079 RepID=A0A9W8YIB3_9PLEO|nr:hypothetical protein N0V83_000691 [Neocucurbitaria cava]
MQDTSAAVAHNGKAFLISIAAPHFEARKGKNPDSFLSPKLPPTIPSSKQFISLFHTVKMSLTFLGYFRFLITYEFYSKVGFLISYTIASLLVLEVLRLVYTDANKREVEKMLDAYTQSRSSSGYTQKGQTSNKISIEDLEKQHPQTPPRPQRRPSSPAATPESEKTLVNNEARRRPQRAHSSASQLQHPATAPAPTSAPQTQTPTPTSPPTRRLRKRSDTVTSTSSSSESKKLERRNRREASPASSSAAGSSKASSRHASPTAVRRVRDKEAQVLSSSLHKLLRQRG